MMAPRSIGIGIAATAALLAALVVPGDVVRAHCDTLDGPVVAAARRALAANDVRLVLGWVRAEDEHQIRAAFERTVRARRHAAARGVADQWFFETLVRVHRAGEGFAFTGLQPSGAEVSRAVTAADRALERGTPEEAERLLVEAIRHGVHERFERARAARNHAPTDVAASRAEVHAYVEWTHYVEHVYAAAAPAPGEREHAPAGDHEGGAHP